MRGRKNLVVVVLRAQDIFNLGIPKSNLELFDEIFVSNDKKREISDFPRKCIRAFFAPRFGRTPQFSFQRFILRQFLHSQSEFHSPQSVGSVFRLYLFPRPLRCAIRSGELPPVAVTAPRSAKRSGKEDTALRPYAIQAVVPWINHFANQ